MVKKDDLCSATQSAEWFLSSASMVHTLLSSPTAVKQHCRSLGNTIDRLLADLQSPWRGGPRASSITRIADSLAIYGPYRFGCVYASSAHEAAIKFSEHVLSKLEVAALATGVIEKPGELSGCLVSKKIKAITEWYRKSAEWYRKSALDENWPEWTAIHAAVLSEAAKASNSEQHTRSASGKRRRGRNEDRDKFAYNRRESGEDLKLIMTAINKNEKWQPFESPQSVHMAIGRYAKRHALPPV